jgi:hypothetical protein
MALELAKSTGKGSQAVDDEFMRMLEGL